jgi:hypothetical protein
MALEQAVDGAPALGGLLVGDHDDVEPFGVA